MKEDRQDLTTGSIWGKMLFFSIPLVLTNFLQVLFKRVEEPTVANGKLETFVFRSLID